MKIHFWAIACGLLAAVCLPVRAQEDVPEVNVQWPEVEHPEVSPIAGITTYPEDYLDWMMDERRFAGNTSIIAIYPEAIERAHHYDDMLQNEGPAALAKALVDAYPAEDAYLELAAGAIALCVRTGYMTYKRSPVGKEKEFQIPKEKKKQMERKQQALPEELARKVTPVIDEILKVDSPYARDTAAEMLLQIFSETLGSGHCESHNGRREIEPMPRELTARAAAFLGSEDPFTHAVAEWAVSVNVFNENETDRESDVWPGENPPEWWDTWFGLPERGHLQLDYIRQTIQLQMHRRGRDLLTLSRDQMRRAQEKAEWVKAQVSDERAAEVAALVAEMKEAHEEFAAVVESNPEDLKACREAFLEWRPTVRPVVMSGPDAGFDRVVYATRFSGGNHGQPGSQDPWRGRGGDIFVQTGLTPGSPTRPVIGDKLPPRLINDMDLWYDGDKVVFAAVHEQDHWQLYEVDLEGEKVTELPATGYDDHNPAYLPDGGVVFGSTGNRAAVMCLASPNTEQSGIHRLNPDRTEIMRLSYSKDDDDYPYVLNDGRVVWMRWDYQERGVDEIFSLWAIRPDGTCSDAFYRVHIPEEVTIQTLRDPKPIVGSQKIIATGGSHRTGNEGALVVADPSMGLSNPLGIRIVNPYMSPTTKGIGRTTRPVEEGGVPYPGGMTTRPWALSEKTFLASMSHDMPEFNFWLYYVDVWGNKELIHRDMLMETICGFPVRPRYRPPVLPDMTDPTKNYALCYVDNVYRDLPNVEKGEVKYIRICKNMGWPIGYSFHPLANASECWGFPGTGGPIQVVGNVPVEKDGSAYFEVPAQMDVYFQALDENYRAVQRMRTHVEFGRGEYRGCLGCHETRESMAQVTRKGAALDKPAVRPTPPPWGATEIMGYETTIQPIFESKCVKCHGAEDPKAGLSLTAQKDAQGFMQGYRAMWGLKPGEKAPGVPNISKQSDRLDNPWKGTYFKDHPWFKVMTDFVTVRKSVGGDEQGIVNIPKRYGAIRHPLSRHLIQDEEHGKLLTDDEMQTLMCWFDIQCPYFSVYEPWDGDGVVVKPYEPFGESREYVYGDR